MLTPVLLMFLLQEEEEQLFSGPKEDSRVSEASRKAVQEEEERLILQKAPLQKKLIDISQCPICVIALSLCFNFFILSWSGCLLGIQNLMVTLCCYSDSGQVWLEGYEQWCGEMLVTGKTQAIFHFSVQLV